MTESIFHKIVTNENSFTQLLCNLMKRDDAFSGAVLALLQNKSAMRLKGEMRITPQKRLPNRCGQPDIIIEAPHLCVIVEVKTESHRNRTKKQELEDGENYLSYLQSRYSSEDVAALAYLVPHNWKFRKEMKDGIATLQKVGDEKNIPVTQVFWEDVLALLPKNSAQYGAPLIEEFRLLPNERFGPINFEPEEIKSMITPEFPMQTVLKLNAVLEGIRKKVGKDETNTCVNKDEFGFYFRKGKRELLFLGYWLAFWDAKHPYPICFGVQEDTPSVKEAFTSAFQKAYKKDPISFDNWTMGWVSEKDFNSLDTVDEIWSKLEPIWNKVKNAAD
jgi:hypothetical protein